MIWSNNFAYAVGLMTSDGNLSKDGRHLIFVSKDLEQIKNFINILHLTSKVGLKKGGYAQVKKYYFVQFSNIKLYRFLISIGLCPKKSKILKELLIPDKYFAHFLRGLFDGDGFTYSYWDKRWKSSFMLYSGFVSASKKFLEWIKETIKRLYKISGSINSDGKSAYQLLYAKKASLVLIKEMYKNSYDFFLKRKRFKIERALSIIKQSAGMLELVDRHA